MSIIVVVGPICFALLLGVAAVVAAHNPRYKPW